MFTYTLSKSDAVPQTDAPLRMATGATPRMLTTRGPRAVFEEKGCLSLVSRVRWLFFVVERG